MKRSGLKPLATLLGNPGSRSARLAARCARLAALDRALYEYLPAPLNAHTRAAAASPERLVLVVDSPVWATRLRYALPDLRRLLDGKLGLRPRTIRIRIQPATAPSPPARRHAHLSPQAAEHLRRAAEQLQDPELAQAVARLARHARARR